MSDRCVRPVCTGVSVVCIDMSDWSKLVLSDWFVTVPDQSLQIYQTVLVFQTGLSDWSVLVSDYWCIRLACTGVWLVSAGVLDWSVLVCQICLSGWCVRLISTCMSEWFALVFQTGQRCCVRPVCTSVSDQSIMICQAGLWPCTVQIYQTGLFQY